MSDLESKAVPTARVFALVEKNDAATERIVGGLIASHNWTRRPAPEFDFQVIQFDAPIDSSEQVSRKADEIHDELSSAGIKLAAVAAHLISPRRV